MIRRLTRNGAFVGSEIDSGPIYFFFGTKRFGREHLADKFPHFHFCFLKQVHGCRVIQGNSPNNEADGHFSKKPGEALVIQTADCVPVLLANNFQVCALHAGWRGVACDIVGESKKKFVDPPTHAVIGPHIGFESFEIGREVLERLAVQIPSGTTSFHLARDHADKSKCYFNLSGLIRLQLLSRFPEIQIFEVDDNTFTSPDYHSFRRDKEQAGRQISFVVLKPKKFA